MGWRVKVWVCAAAAVLIISAGVVGAWAYLEHQELERGHLLDCYRLKTLEEDVVPGRRILDDDAGQCAQDLDMR